jgi:hypothetical protein
VCECECECDWPELRAARVRPDWAQCEREDAIFGKGLGTTIMPIIVAEQIPLPKDCRAGGTEAANTTSVMWDPWGSSAGTARIVM